MTEILHFEILRKHGQTNMDKHTHTHTHKQTDMGITIPRPPPMGGEVKTVKDYILTYLLQKRSQLLDECKLDYHHSTDLILIFDFNMV